MLTYVGSRLIQMVAVLLVASVGIFALVRLIPGDPAVALAGADAPPEVVQAIREQLALDRPLVVQYGQWLSHVARGDLGQSTSARVPVRDLILLAAPASIQLTVAAMCIAILVGGALGVAAAARHQRWPDVAVGVVTGTFIGIPAFWLGLILLLLFSLTLGWLPSGGWVDVFQDPLEGLRSLLLPAVTLGVIEGAVIARFMRASMLDALQEDHVRTARAKGLAPSAVLRRHGIRNALIPVVTVIGVQAGHLLGGVVVVEMVFSWPGLGRLVVGGIGQRDYAVVQGVLLLFVATYVVINLCVDLLYGYLDPRTRSAR
jgi:peptide/nickel transport system permease protein